MSSLSASNLLLAILEESDAGVTYTPVRLLSQPAVTTLAFGVRPQDIGDPALAPVRVLVATPMPSLREVESGDLTLADWGDLAPALCGIVHMSDAIISCVTGLEIAGWDDEAAILGHPLVVGLRDQITHLCAAWALTLPANWRRNPPPASSDDSDGLCGDQIA